MASRFYQCKHSSKFDGSGLYIVMDEKELIIKAINKLSLSARAYNKT